MNQVNYIGTELELFAEAQNWKNYIGLVLRNYIHGDVLEVGAGIGGTTRVLYRFATGNWICLEPDPKLFPILQQSLNSDSLPNCSADNYTIDYLQDQELFDAILYINVLEHIPQDREQVISASQHLKSGGHLLIIAAAHQWLLSPFDIAVGHCRRYNKQMLKALLPADMKLTKIIYLDCIGLLASLANKLVLKQSKPTLKQIKSWDRLMIPISKKIDPIINYSVGKSILMVAQKK